MKALLWLVILAIVAAGIWFALRPTRPPIPGRALTFLLTCDVHGRLVPCGCFSGQLGGLTRIATMFGPKSPNQVRLDAGDAIAGPVDYEQIQYGYIQQAFGQMGYDALNVGQREAHLSAAQLREIKVHSPVTMLSANLLDKSTGAPLFDSHKIIERAGWRIALVGVLDGRALGENLGEGLAVEDMDVTLGRLLPQLKGRADAIVLLAFADETAMTNLARQFYELDVILGGNVRQPSQQLVKENRSLILATTNESRAIGFLQVVCRAPQSLGALKGEVRLVSDQIPQDQSIAALAAAYRDQVRQTKLAIDDPNSERDDMVPGVRPRNAYAGTVTCALCHPSAYHVWSESGHARAFASLIAVQADADPNCLSCHTVGFGAASGYRRAAGASGTFVDVGCESCHGPGAEHVQSHRAGSEVTAHFHPVGAGDCQKCHHGEFSRPFDYATFWPNIVHGKEAAVTLPPNPGSKPTTVGASPGSSPGHATPNPRTSAPRPAAK